MSNTMLTMNLELEEKELIELVESLGYTVNKDKPQLYTIFLGKKEGKFSYPYIAINKYGKLRGYSSLDDIQGNGTDKIGKFTLEEIEERFPQFNSAYFLVPIID